MMIFRIFFILFEMKIERKEDEIKSHESDLDVISVSKNVDDVTMEMFSVENGGESVMLSDTEEENLKEKRRSLSRPRGTTIEINTNIDQSSFLDTSSDDQSI